MTIVDEIYEEFLQSITSYTTLSPDLPDDVVRSELRGYLNFAIREFRQCRKSLVIEENNLTNQQYFVEELGNEEIKVILSFMLVAYMKPVVYNDEGLRQAISDKTFRVNSQANHVSELSLLYRQAKKEAEKNRTEYTWLEALGDDA